MFYSPVERDAAPGMGANAFGPAQSVLNVIEIAVNLLYLFLAVGMEAPSASVVGLVVNTATFAKTLLYFVMVYVYQAHFGIAVVPSAALASPEDIKTFVGLWLIPNGIWLVVPFAACVTLGKQLAANNR